MVRDCHFYNCELLLPLSSHRQRLPYVQSSPPASWNSCCFLPMGNAPKPKQLLQPETVTCEGPEPSWIKRINPQATASLPAVCLPLLSVDAQTCLCSHVCFITNLSVSEVSYEVGFVMWLFFHFPLFKITTTLCNPSYLTHQEWIRLSHLPPTSAARAWRQQLGNGSKFPSEVGNNVFSVSKSSGHSGERSHSERCCRLF